MTPIDGSLVLHIAIEVHVVERDKESAFLDYLAQTLLRGFSIALRRFKNHLIGDVQSKPMQDFNSSLGCIASE
jgi:hypothetical protein